MVKKHRNRTTLIYVAGLELKNYYHQRMIIGARHLKRWDLPTAVVSFK